MRRFYALWFPFCGVWGYLFATLQTQVMDMHLSIVGALKIFLACGVIFGAMAGLVLLFSSASAQSARLHVDLRPWDDPLGVFQFVFVTFIFVGFWTVVLSYVLPSARRDFGLFLLAMSGGGFVGLVLTSLAYRRWRT